MNKEASLQDIFLDTLRQDKVPVSVYLINGIKLQGLIEAFDQYIITLKSNVTQLIYKHAVSTIVPIHPVSFANGNSEHYPQRFEEDEDEGE